MSTFGTLFKVSTFGESHGDSVGCIVDGCPPGLKLSVDDIQPFLNRRKPGSKFSSTRQEQDICKILSGIEFNTTLGSPIAVFVKNLDFRPLDYQTLNCPRPSHADLTYLLKYGLKSSSGGGRASARESIGRVAAGAIAEKYLKQACNINIVAFVASVGDVVANIDAISMDQLTRDFVDSCEYRCPDTNCAQLITQILSDCIKSGDSIGSTVACIIKNCPQGLGEPCFDKLPALLAHAMMSIPASRGFEIGKGFEASRMFGSAHNDVLVKSEIIQPPNSIKPLTNNAGGVIGGISNGDPIFFKVAFKPPASISKCQETASYNGSTCKFTVKGRHDPCIASRAVPIVEAMAAITIMDAFLIQNSRVFSSFQLENHRKQLFPQELNPFLSSKN